MNNSNNEWSIVRGSNNNKQFSNNKKYVLSQLITKRISIDDIIKRTDINLKFKNSIVNLDDNYIKNIVSKNNTITSSTDNKKYKVCQSCFTHNSCQNYNNNNFKTYLFDNLEFIVCYSNSEDDIYYFHIDIIFENNTLQFLPVIINKKTPTIKSVKPTEEVNIKNITNVTNVTNVKKKVIIEKFEKICDEEIVIENIKNIENIKTKENPITKNELIKKFKKNFNSLDEVNNAITYWIDKKEHYTEYTDIIDKYIIFLLEEKDIQKLVYNINAIYKTENYYTEDYSYFDKEMQYKIYNKIFNTPGYCYYKI